MTECRDGPSSRLKLDERFRFYYEGDSQELHITVRHRTTVDDAVAAFFEAITFEWDEAHLRWESVSGTHVLLWTRHAFDGSIVVISCMRREVGNA